MALIVHDGADDTKYIDSDGAGTLGDPYVMAHTLRASTAAIGKLAANSGVDIGDVDVVTLMGLGAGQAVSASSIPVTIASNQTYPNIKRGAVSSHVTLTVTNGAYSIGDVVGGLITFTGVVSANGKSAKVNSIKLAGVTAIGYELMLISADISTPKTDNQALAMTAGDLAIILGGVKIIAANYLTYPLLATIPNVGLQVEAGAGTTNIYAYLIATEVTSPNTTAIELTVDFEQMD